MLLSSPRTRFLKTALPVILYAMVTGISLWVSRHELLTNPGMVLFVLLLGYACAAWTLWRPFRLKVADSVEEAGDTLIIRRGAVEARVPYTGILSHEWLRIGTTAAVRLEFKEPTPLGKEVGFYIDEALGPRDVLKQDASEHLERQLEKYRHGRAV